MLDLPTLTVDQLASLSADQLANLILVDGLDTSTSGGVAMYAIYYRRRRRLRGGDG